MLVVKLLQAGGHLVLVAKNGKDAVDPFEKLAFDLVLMDVQMPEMDGFEATEAIRGREKAIGRHTPIVAITATAMVGDGERNGSLRLEAPAQRGAPGGAGELFESRP